MSTRSEKPRGIQSIDNKYTIRHLPMAADFDAPAGTAVKIASGYVTPVDTNSDPVFAITQENGKNGSTAGGAKVACYVSEETIFAAVASAGSFSVADIGKVCDIAASGRALLRTAATSKNFKIVDVRGDVAFVRLDPSFTNAS